MKYIKVSWIHAFENEPALFYHEIDENNFERRKIEIYKDGNIERVSGELQNETTYLSPVELPSIDEINADPQFAAEEIGKDDFEAMWHL